MDGDLFLEWLSLRGRGSISDVTSSMAAFIDGRSQKKILKAQAYLRRLEVLGHLDLFWPENRWQIRPAMLTHLPGPSAFALVLGRRTQVLEDQLDSEVVLHEVVPTTTGTFSIDSPKTLLVEYDDEAQLSEVAANAGAMFVPNLAMDIATNLPTIGPGPRSGGPNNYGSPVQVLDQSSWRFNHIEVFHRDGLYRQIVNGRNQYWLLESDCWYSTSYAEGVCLIMSKVNSECLELKIFEDTEGSIGTLMVKSSLPLPILHSRALALCSGVDPYRKTGTTRAYKNVPLSIAAAVAHSIHQHLQMS